MTPVVVTVAITGSVPRKKDNPAVPITPAEQIESTRGAFEAGATLAHIHVRNDDETPSSDPERFAKVMQGYPNPVSRHDRAVFDRRARTGPAGPGQFAFSKA